MDLESLSIYEKDIEEIVVDSDSDDNNQQAYTPGPTKSPAKDKESVKKKGANSMYSTMQQLLGGGDVDEPPLRILKKATALCTQLCQEELNMKLETEILLQQNWKLKRRFEQLQKKKRRISGTATISRRLSGPPHSPNQTYSIERRSASIDESKLVNSQIDTTVIQSDSKDKDESSKITPVSKNRRRKTKKRSGLSEEEKEFYKVEEKIEDILHEVEGLWADVQKDEEKESKEVDESIKIIDSIPVNWATPSGPSHLPKPTEKIKLTDISKLMDPDLSPLSNNEVIKIANIPFKKEGIKITNINKLLDPIQNPILKTHEFFTLTDNSNENRRSSTSGDESPRLIIDENPHTVGNENSTLTQKELDVMEALQAVDTLCLSLVSDEPTTSASQPVSTEIRKLNKSDIIAISDSEDENSDIVCLE